jgi:hypothetical protein
MPDKTDRKKQVHLPWATSASNPIRYVQHIVAGIRDAAGLDRDITFTSSDMAVTRMQWVPD